MASWDAVVTNDGNSLLSTWLSGTKLNIDSAEGGAGTVDVAALVLQTKLVNKKQDLSIIRYEKVSNGIKIKIQITAPDVGYTLNQISVKCSVDGGSSVMTALFQNSTGLQIPSKSETPDFLCSFFGIIIMSNTGDITITIDTTALVSHSILEAGLAAKQDIITAERILFGHGAGIITTAVAGTDYGYPLLKGTVDPTSATAAEVGQHYFNTATGKEFVCTAAVSGVYTWAQVGGGEEARYYGACATAADTAAKVVTCAGFELVSGARIAVMFNNANSAASPTLNVNGTGALTISRLSNWEVGSIVIFAYAGTYWRMVEAVAQKSFYGISATAVATVAKVVTCTAFTSGGLASGTRVSVRFTYANTAASPTLNINSTGAKAIYMDGALAASGAWKANETVDFVYTGSYWDIVSSVSSNERVLWNKAVVTADNAWTLAESLDAPIGAIRTYGFELDDPEWLLCDARVLSVNEYPKLYNKIGRNYGWSPVEWTLRQTNTAVSHIQSVCWSPKLGLFVAVGYNTSNYGLFYTSPDGLTWTLRQTLTAVSYMTSVCWSPEKALFVAVGYNTNNYGIFYTSSDGLTWTLRQTNTSASIMKDVCWSPELSLFAAVGMTTTTGSAQYVATSPDGITWTTRGTSSADYYSVCWSPELRKFVAGGKTGAYLYFGRSSDGITWSNTVISGSNFYPCSVCWSPELNLFVAVGYEYRTSESGSPYYGLFYTSPDGITWTRRLSPLSVRMYSVRWSPELSLFVAAGYETTNNYAVFYTSDDGLTWTLRQTLTAVSYMTAVCWSPEKALFVAVGYNTNNYGLFYTSPQTVEAYSLPDYNEAMPFTYIRAVKED